MEKPYLINTRKIMAFYLVKALLQKLSIAGSAKLIPKNIKS